jgi:hypothetical protein
MIHKKKVAGYSDGGDVGKGLLRRYNRHLSPEFKEASKTNSPESTIAKTDEGSVVTGANNTATGDAGYVKTKYGATIFQSNPANGAMNTDVNHMNRVIKTDREKGWNNFVSRFGFQKKTGTQF